MIQDSRVGCAQVPLHLPGRRMADRGQRGCNQFRSSQATCLLPGGHPRLTPGTWDRGTCTHASTICTRRHHPLAVIAFSHSGGIPGRSACSAWSASSWGKWLSKGAAFKFFILVLMSLAMLLTPKDTPEATHCSLWPSAKMPLSPPSLLLILVASAFVTCLRVWCS